MSESKLIPCPQCSTQIEPWQITCHGCGQKFPERIKIAEVAFHVPIPPKKPDFPPEIPQFDIVHLPPFHNLENLVPASDMDRLWAQLYCPNCGRMLMESQIYGLRKGRKQNFRCFCGFEGLPFVNREELAARQDEQSRLFSERRRRLMEIAQKNYPNGKKRWLAIACAIIGGAVGVHRFYLGERFAGYYYLALSWTFIPLCLALIDAIHYWQMTRVSFNMAYNMELVFADMPPDDSLAQNQTHLESFSMDLGENANEASR